MDENRKFFRIKNKGTMLASIGGQPVHVLNVSACSAALLTETEVPLNGILELKINLFQINLNYQFLRIDAEKTIVVFNNEEQNAKLLTALKNLRRE